MEKFGIFELLDALSALTAREDGAPSPAQTEATPPPADYGARTESTTEAPAPAAHVAKSERDALAGFLARHDAIAKKAANKGPTES